MLARFSFTLCLNPSTGTRCEADGAVKEAKIKKAEQLGYTSALDIGNNPQPHCTQFYKCQSLQSLGEESDRVDVPIYIDHESDGGVHKEWEPHLNNAIAAINQAAPGLNLHKVSDLTKAKVLIYGTRKKKSSTNGDILSSQCAKIFLHNGRSNKKRTSVHELLHALGFDHEHQRRDASQTVGICRKKRVASMFHS